MESGVDSINGPVSFYILKSPNGKVTFYMFGDAHFSKSLGCDRQERISMAKGGATLSAKSIMSRTATAIDVDAAVYLLLMYGKKTSTPTDAFVELSPARKDAPKSAGWFHNISALMANRKQFAPTCNIYPTDARYNEGYGKDDVVRDIFTTLFNMTSSLMDTEMPMSEVESLIALCETVLNNTTEVFDAITAVGQVYRLSGVIRLLEKLPKSTFQSDCIESLENMINASELVKLDGKLVKCHVIAKALHDLETMNRYTAQISRANIEYFKHSTDKLLSDVREAQSLSVISSTIKETVQDDEFVERVLSAHLIVLSDTLIAIGAHVMDIYTATRAFISRAPQKVIVAGNAHINTYYNLLTTVHNYNVEFKQANFIEYYDEERQVKERDYTRCVSSRDLPAHLDFAAMKDIVYDM